MDNNGVNINGGPFDLVSILENPSDVDVHELNFEFSTDFADDIERFNVLMIWAGIHGLRHLKVRGSYGFMDKSEESDHVFISISHSSRSLENLMLEGFKFDVVLAFGVSCSCFQKLTALSLTNCCLDFCSSDQLEPFDHFPMLQHLSLSCCSCDIPELLEDPRCLVINGEQLITLEINKPVGFTEINVLAAKLHSFTYRHEILEGDLLPTEVLLEVQSLETADIVLLGHNRLGGDEMIKHQALEYYANLFHGLRHAKSLVFEFDDTITFYDVCKLLREEPNSPFGRLESLTLRHKEHITLIPQYVKDCFFGTSPPSVIFGDQEIKMTKLAMIHVPSPSI